jgi:hypothetical protein
MQMSRLTIVFASKVVLAVVLLGSFAAYVGLQLAPKTPTYVLLAWLVLVAFVGFAFLFGLVAIGGGWNQMMLKEGATDAQWFWFNAEPPGLEEMRAQLKTREDQKV